MSPIRRSDDKPSPTSLPTAPLPPPETASASANGHSTNAEPATLAQTEADDNNNTGDPQIDPELASLPAPGTLSITESILQAPNPRPADFSMMPITSSDIDITALDEASLDGAPGSPTAKLMKAIAPPNAAQPDAKWAPVSASLYSCFASERSMRVMCDCYRYLICGWPLKHRGWQCHAHSSTIPPRSSRLDADVAAASKRKCKFVHR